MHLWVVLPQGLPALARDRRSDFQFACAARSRPDRDPILRQGRDILQNVGGAKAARRLLLRTCTGRVHAPLFSGWHIAVAQEHTSGEQRTMMRPARGNGRAACFLAA